MQIITPCTLSWGFFSSTQWNVSLFYALVCHYSHCRHRDFPQRCSFFISHVKCGSNPINYIDFFLLPACLHVTLPTPCLVTVAAVSDSGATWMRKRNERGDWVVWLNHWPISDLIVELIACFTLCECDRTSGASGIVVNKWTRECSTIWTHKENTSK